MEVTNSTPRLAEYCKARDKNRLPLNIKLKGSAAQEIETEILLFEMAQQNLTWEQVTSKDFLPRFCELKEGNKRVYLRYGRKIYLTL